MLHMETSRKLLRTCLVAAFGIFAFAFSTVQAEDLTWETMPDSEIADWVRTSGGQTTVYYHDTITQSNTSNHTLIIKGPRTSAPTQITAGVYGGYSSSTDNKDAVQINSNTVIIKAPSNPNAPAISGDVNVYGGYKNYGNGTTNKVQYVNGNEVTIESGVDLGTGTVAGAWIFTSSAVHVAGIKEASNNTVNIGGGSMRRIAGAVLDHRTDGVITMKNNTVNIDLRNNGSLTVGNGAFGGGDASAGTIYGADLHEGTVTNNKIYFYANNSSEIKELHNVIAGRSGYWKGAADNNSILVDFTARTDPAAASFAIVAGGSSGSESNHATLTVFGDNTAQNNKVTMSGTTAANVKAQAVVGAKTVLGISTFNKVYLTDVTVTGTNDTTVDDGKQNMGVMGGYVANSNRNTMAAGTKQGRADNNTVDIVRGSVDGDIYGGLDYTLEAGVTSLGASNNTVSLKDVTVNSNEIYGGYSRNGGATVGNKVSIEGYGMSFNPAATLAGGTDNANFVGNSLTTTTAINLTLDTIENFQNYTYNMTANEMDETVYFVANDVDFTGTTHTLNFDATQGPHLEVDQELVLIDKTVNGVNDPDRLPLNIKDGFLYNYDGIYEIRGNADGTESLIFRLTEKTEDERNVSFGQSQLVGLQMVNLASDLARSVSGLYNMAADCDPCYDPCSDPCSAQKKGGAVLFAGTQGGKYHWNTGYDSRVDLKHISMITGLGWRFDNLLLAGFFEAGHGNYDAKVRGIKLVDGDKTNYIGGGALARYELGGFYAETGFHAGRVKTDFESIKFGNHLGPVHVKYQNKSNYVGVDALLGYKFDAGCSTFDFSARYSWNRVKGDDFAANDIWFEQETSNSHRVRAGAEWSYNMKGFHPYAGAYYEYEFDSESAHKVLGSKLAKASKKGSNGIGTIGLRFGGGERRLSADIGVEGFVGQRRGIAGKALVGYAF